MHTPMLHRSPGMDQNPQVPPPAPGADLIPALPLDVARDCLLRVPLDGHPTLQQVCTSWRAAASDPSFAAERRHKGYSQSYACFLQAAPSSSPASARKAPVYGITLYDPRHATWTSLPPIPDFSDLGLPLFCQCVAVGERLVIIGGWDPVSWSVLTSVYIYDFTTGLWQRGADMPIARSFFAAAAAIDRASGDATVLVAGGHDQDKNALRSSHLYHIGSNTWEALPDMTHQRDECAAVALSGGRFIVVSGFSTESQGQFLPSAEIYDPATGTWALYDAVWPAGKPPSSILPIRGELHAFVDGNLVVYKPDLARSGANGSDGRLWKTVTAIPSELGVVSSAAVLGGDRILVCGYSGRADEPSKAFTCALTAAPVTWRKVPSSSHGLCGVAQTSCTVEV